MKSFQDKKGSFWDLELNIGISIKLKSRLDFDINRLISVDPNENSCLKELSEDPELLFNVIYVFCEKQCHERQISQEDFAELFDRATIDNAVKALLEEFVNFSPSPKKRILQEMLKVSDQVSEEVEKKIDQVLSGGIKKNIEEELKKLYPNAQEV